MQAMCTSMLAIYVATGAIWQVAIALILYKPTTKPDLELSHYVDKHKLLSVI